MTKEERIQNEIIRLKEMYQYQKELQRDYSFVFGIDEAGRGPLCGPVAAACCILPEDPDILYLNDSKKLSEKKREELYTQIIEKCEAFGIGTAGPERIDTVNILNATYEAMNDAYEACLKMLESRGTPSSLMKEMSLILVDGNRAVPFIREKQITVVSGDAKCPSISAASILAKVTRDHLLYEYDKQYPEYGFARNKGYGTKEHIEALKKYGPLPVHRMSFIQKFI